jgi:hypothetical protein
MTLMTEVAAAPESLTDSTSDAPWSVPVRIGFRFAVIYFTLYVCLTQMLQGLIPLPVGGLPDLTYWGPSTTLFSWVARHVFGVTGSFVAGVTGSGDRTLDYVQAFCLLVVAAAGTIVWSALTRRREHRGAQKWIWIFLRFALATTLISYGIVKAVPLQMPAPGLTRLLERYADLSPMGVLWASVGASRSYEITVGCMELAGGILLFVPRLWMLGALVALVDMGEVFTLNMTYDVPVKLFSFQLILMALFLLAPEMRRLANVLVFNRTAKPSTLPVPGRTPGRRRAIVAAQLVFGAYVLGLNAYGARQGWYQYGGGAPKSPLYGIWNVERMTIDGVERSPLLTDSDRWRYVVFQTPAFTAFQRMDGTFAYFGAKLDPAKQTLKLSAGKQENDLTFERSADDRLSLAGALNGHAVTMRMRRVDHTKFLLVSRGFHWVQERPFNR